MNQNIQEFEKKLLELKREILEKLQSDNEEVGSLLSDESPKDIVDVASEDVDKNLLQTLGIEELKRLEQIESALARLKSGHFGKCVKCGGKISEDRLDAIPYALVCIQCKSSSEKRR